MDPITLMIVALISAVLGYGLSSLLSNRRGSDNPPTPDVSSPPNESANPPTASSQPEDKARLTMVTFWREQPSGVLRADLDGRVIKGGSDLTPEQRRRLVNVIADMRPWLAPPGAPAPIVGESSAQPAPIDGQPVVSQPISRPVSAQAIPGALPASPAKPAPPKSIVGQIDDLLQERLLGTPMENRGIRLEELPNLGMAVRVGMQKYDSIDEVPDEEIKNAIRTAVKLWENRAG